MNKSDRLERELLTKLATREVTPRIAEYWEPYIGSLKRATRRFVHSGLLQEATDAHKIATSHKVTDLKALLRERGLPVSGRKDELVDRLLNAVSPREARRIAGRMTLYQATDAGQGLIDEYKAFQKQERKTAEGAAKEALLAGDYEQAALTISAYEAKQPFERGMWIGIGDTGSVWGPDRHPFRVSALQEMMTLRPWFLDGLTDDECAQIQIAAAMSVLCGERPARFGRGIQLTSPTRFEPKWLVNMQSSYALNRYTLRELQGVVGVVTTTTCNDQYVCASCKRMSERRFPLRQAPELPSPECTSETGCRCWYLPVID